MNGAAPMATRPPRKPTTSGRSARAPGVQRCRQTPRLKGRLLTDGAGRAASAPARISHMDHLLCPPCARRMLAGRNGRLRTFMHCREGKHELLPECPNGHGVMITTPRGEKARCPVLTGRDQRGRTTWCGALRDPVTYGPDGLPVDQGRRD